MYRHIHTYIHTYILYKVFCSPVRTAALCALSRIRDGISSPCSSSSSLSTSPSSLLPTCNTCMHLALHEKDVIDASSTSTSTSTCTTTCSRTCSGTCIHTRTSAPASAATIIEICARRCLHAEHERQHNGILHTHHLVGRDMLLTVARDILSTHVCTATSDVT